MIHYDDVGYLYDTTEKKIIFNEPTDGGLKDGEMPSDEYLNEKFALPTAAREILLGVVIHDILDCNLSTVLTHLLTRGLAFIRKTKVDISPTSLVVHCVGLVLR